MNIFKNYLPRCLNQNSPKDILAAMVCSAEPVEQMLLNKISSVGLQELIQVGLLRQQERSIRFAYPEMRRVVTSWVKIEFLCR